MLLWLSQQSLLNRLIFLVTMLCWLQFHNNLVRDVTFPFVIVHNTFLLQHCSPICQEIVTEALQWNTRKVFSRFLHFLWGADRQKGEERNIYLTSNGDSCPIVNMGVVTTAEETKSSLFIWTWAVSHKQAALLRNWERLNEGQEPCTVISRL